MKLVRLTHANTGDEIFLFPDRITYIYRSKNAAATHIVFTGGNFFPAKESVDEVHRLIAFTDDGEVKKEENGKQA